MNNKEILVFIPAYNEENNLKKVLEDLVSNNYSILVVDDGSTDATFNIATKMSVEVIRHSHNKGYEKALSSGLSYAIKNDYSFAISFDADGQMFADDIKKLINLAKERDADIVVGKRQIKNRIFEYFVGALTRFYFSISDPLCGLKLYKISTIARLLPFDTKNLAGTELLIKALQRRGFNILEMKIDIKKRIDKAKFGNFLTGEIKILRVFFIIVFLILTSGYEKK